MHLGIFVEMPQGPPAQSAKNKQKRLPAMKSRLSIMATGLRVIRSLNSCSRKERHLRFRRDIMAGRLLRGFQMFKH